MKYPDRLAFCRLPPALRAKHRKRKNWIVISRQYCARITFSPNIQCINVYFLDKLSFYLEMVNYDRNTTRTNLTSALNTTTILA